MNCSKCGMLNDKGVSFCANCGTPLVNTNLQNNITDNNQQGISNENNMNLGQASAQTTNLNDQNISNIESQNTNNVIPGQTASQVQPNDQNINNGGEQNFNNGAMPVNQNNTNMQQSMTNQDLSKMPKAGKSKGNVSTSSYIGLCSLGCTLFINVILGVILAVAGIYYAIVEKKNGNNSFKKGLIINIISIVVAIASYVFVNIIVG